MPQTPPISGPHEFSSSKSDVDGVTIEALAFIAQRMAGIEWVLGEMNQKMFKIQDSLNVVAHKMK